MKVSRVYWVESGEYVAVYFYPNLLEIVGAMGVLSFPRTPTPFAHNGHSCVAHICFVDPDQVLWPEPHTTGMTYCLFPLIWYARCGRQSRGIRLESISTCFHLRSPSRRRHWQSLATGPG